MDYRIEQLRYRLREEPESRVFYQLGEILRREGSLAESISVLEQGLVHNPRYVAAWVALGRALAAAERGAEAEKAFARALELDPENSVAARSIGEIAATRGDWVRAVKAFKLARVLSPGDTSLEGRISEVETQLVATGMLEAPSRPQRGTTAPPPVAAVRRRRAPQTVVSVSDGDPFAVTTSSDTGVFVIADDVFGSGKPAVAVAPGAPPPPQAFPTYGTDDDAQPEDVPAEVGGAAVSEAESEQIAAEAGWGEQDESEDVAIAEPVAIEAAVNDESADAAEADLEAPAPAVTAPSPFLREYPEEDYSDEYPADEPDDEGPTELPLPTMTLARLALQQGDRDLAERTLVGVLERDPEQGEARSLLLSLRSAASGPAITRSVALGRDARVAALQGWLDTIRLAAENRRR